MNSQVNPYDSDAVKTLQQYLSPERFSTYRDAVGGDLAKAMTLYDWNLELAAALWADLQRLEVALRNAMNDRLTEQFGKHWYDRPGLLPDERQVDVAKARSRLERRQQPKTQGRIVTELSFGFWRFLLIGRLEPRLWRTALYRAFPHLKSKRKVLERKENRLHELRNRISHCEPVFNRDISADLHAIEAVAGWIDPELKAWITRHCTVRAVLDRRPT